jgi:hypothetical protein
MWALLAMIVVSLGLSVLATSIFGAHWDGASAEDRVKLTADPIGLILQPAASYGQIAVVILGVMVIASEFSTGTIRSSLLATPRRWPMLAAKAAVFAGVVFVVAELVAIPAVLIGKSILSDHVRVSLTDPAVLRATLGFGLYLAVMGLFALGVGAIVRHVGGSITAALGLVIVVPVAISLVPGKTGEYLSAYLPGGSCGQAVMSSGRDASALVSPWAGFAASLGWTVLILLLAAMMLRRRDVSGT